LVRTITADEIDFSPAASTAVVSDTLRFILPIPVMADGGAPLRQVEGEAAGQPFIGQDGRPIEGRGLAFFNPDDGCNDFARCDGRAAIIVGHMTEELGRRLDGEVRSLAADPGQLGLDDLRAILTFATERLGLTAHSASRDYVRDAMTPLDAAGVEAYGLHRRRGDQQCRAVYVAGAGRFLGPAATPQVFSDGAVIIALQGAVWLAQPASFEAHYKHPDGRSIRVAELAAQIPRGQ
jgi:hypothetical protein